MKYLCAGLLLLFILNAGCGPDSKDDPLPTLDDLALLDFEWENPAAAEPAPAAYMVAAGDTLFSIARRFGLDVIEIKLRSGLSSDVIQPGMILALTGGDAGSDEGREGLSAFLEKRRASWMIPDGH